MSAYRFILILILLFGLAVGSFLNVVIYRLPRHIAFGSRSVCPKCQSVLGVQDLVPVLSFLFLKGKCRFCSGEISWHYPLVEILTGLIFCALFASYGLSANMLLYIAFSTILVSSAFIDLELGIIPNKIIVFGPGSGALVHLLLGTGDVKTVLMGFAAGGIPLLAIFLLSRGGMGAGDVKLASVIGVFIGLPLVFISLFISFLLGAAVGVFLLLLRIKGRKDAVPFGPFLACGGIAAVFWGERILNWYLSFY